MSGVKDWPSQEFRNAIIARIDDVIRTFGMNTSRNSSEMENLIYLKARTREEYLAFIARLILHMREHNNKKSGMQAEQPQAGGMQDLTNALQNSTIQGSVVEEKNLSMSGENKWSSRRFRKCVIARIDNAIRTCGMNTFRSSIEMENLLHLKAKTRGEYLGFVARLILHIRETNNNTSVMQAEQPQAGGMPNPINAL